MSGREKLNTRKRRARQASENDIERKEIHSPPRSKKIRSEASANDSTPDQAESSKVEKSSAIVEVSPSTVYFSQNTIENKFGCHKRIYETLEELKTQKISPTDIEHIVVVDIGGNYVTRDNRRLYVFQKYEDFLERKLLIPVRVGPIEEIKNRLTTDSRRSIKVIRAGSKRGSQGNSQRRLSNVKVIEEWSCPKIYK